MERILVALDGSPRAPKVLGVAVNLARHLGAKLILMRGVGIPPEMPRDFWRESSESFQDLLRDHARDYLEEQKKKVPADLSATISVLVGSPWQSICDAAKAENADLVVIGSHGYSGLDRVLGTTAAKVVDHCDRSVLVVRASERIAE
jgi:nucleotide-binding universal stress UspA family protein